VNDPQLILAEATALGALGMWLILPRPSNRGRAIGVVLAATGLGLLASQMSGLGHVSNDLVFAIMAGVTVVAAVATVTFRSPVYCAIWFGLTLLGTAGLFMFQGAQFLAVATIVVYAGAILVTFLFVLMLAQPEGHTHYDRLSWEPMVSAFTGAVIVGVLAMTVTNVLAAEPPQAPAAAQAAERERGVLAQNHVARIGAELFDRHLIAVELAGTLLLAALVGAAVIVGQGKGPLAGSKSTENNQVPARQ
jgi:NADH-quinone oxidoreductase subunit J